MGDSWSPRCAYTGSPNHDLGATDPWSPVSVDPWARRQAARDREAARENGGMEGARGWREGGSDDVRQGGSGSGGREGGLREGGLKMERARKGRTEEGNKGGSK